MFTGIIETAGTVRALVQGDGGLRLVIQAGGFLDGARIGDSIAVNGVCVTITKADGTLFEADLGAETLRRTTLGQLQPGVRVNLERPLAIGDRLGGHLVQGHVDGVGRVLERRQDGQGWWVEIAIPRALARYVVEKGSIAVDGVSLTVASVTGDRFGVSLIPHTCAVTTLGGVQVGAYVNLEVDILAKYVERLAGAYAGTGDGGLRGGDSVEERGA